MNAETAIALLERHPWRFARTMPQYPHWYTLRRQWKDQAQFEAVVQFIRDAGVRRRFGGREYTYFDAGGFTYWTMGAPLHKTILVNRARPSPEEAEDEAQTDLDLHRDMLGEGLNG